jgi:hypothetical protein
VPEYAARVFADARECFEEIAGWLSGAGAGGLDHGRLEQELGVRGREMQRLLYQAHLDLRAAREERREDVTGADGVARTRVEKGRRRGLATVFGQVTVTRMAYRAPGAASLHPGDAVLNLPAGKHSHGLSRLAAIESARGSFGQAGEAIGRVTGVRLGKRQAEQLARAAARDADGFYAARRPGPGPDGDALVLQVDGKGIVMRPGALREATAARAAAAGHKLTTRLSRGEKRNRKRIAEVGCVYDAAPVPRTAADIIRAPGDEPRPRVPGPAARDKWLTASVTAGMQQVIAAVFDEAGRRDPGHRRQWVVLADGNKQQISCVQAEAARRGVRVAVICDFVHVLEYVWKAAWCFFREADPAAEAWVAGHARAILEGHASTVAAAIRCAAARPGLTASQRKSAEAAAGYLTAKAPYLDYATALASGWPIATGAIEGACRHLIKDRMDITGARWGLPGAEAILMLRAIITNGDFDAYWNYHLDKEQQHVHHARYRDGPQLAA